MVSLGLGVHMMLIRLLRKGNRGLISSRTAILGIAALSLLVARTLPPHLPHLCSGVAVTSHADQNHRPCFDHQDLQWGTSPVAVLLTPPPIASPHLTATTSSIVEIAKDGWHFNRPPPIS